MADNEYTSKRIGTLAAIAMRRQNASKTMKSLAGSALTQRPDHPKKVPSLREIYFRMKQRGEI